MSIRQFQQELSRGMPSRVYLLYSSDDFLLYEALSAIKEQCSDAVGFNFDVYDIKSPDDTIPVEQIVDIVNTMPFISARRDRCHQQRTETCQKGSTKARCLPA